MENIDKLIENLELATEPELRWMNPEDAYIGCGDVPDELCQRAAACIRQLRQQNAELLKALTNLYESCRWEKVCPTIDAAKDAIAKATGGEK